MNRVKSYVNGMYANAFARTVKAFLLGAGRIARQSLESTAAPNRPYAFFAAPARHSRKSGWLGCTRYQKCSVLGWQ